MFSAALHTVYLARGRCTSGAFPIAFPNLGHQEKLLSLGNGLQAGLYHCGMLSNIQVDSESYRSDS